MNTGKDIPVVGNKSSTDCENSLSLGEEVFQALGPFLRGLLGGSKDCMHQIAFPNTAQPHPIIMASLSQTTSSGVKRNQIS